MEHAWKIPIAAAALIVGIAAGVTLSDRADEREFAARAADGVAAVEAQAAREECERLRNVWRDSQTGEGKQAAKDCIAALPAP